jgi:hypothetical protein
LAARWRGSRAQSSLWEPEAVAALIEEAAEEVTVEAALS